MKREHGRGNVEEKGAAPTIPSDPLPSRPSRNSPKDNRIAKYLISKRKKINRPHSFPSCGNLYSVYLIAGYCVVECGGDYAQVRDSSHVQRVTFSTQKVMTSTQPYTQAAPPGDILIYPFSFFVRFLNYSSVFTFFSVNAVSRFHSLPTTRYFEDIQEPPRSILQFSVTPILSSSAEDRDTKYIITIPRVRIESELSDKPPFILSSFYSKV